MMMMKKIPKKNITKVQMTQNKRFIQTSSLFISIRYQKKEGEGSESIR